MIVESRAGTKADHLTIHAAQTCFIFELHNCIHRSLSRWFLYFFFSFCRMERSLFFLYIFLNQTTLHRHRCSLVALQARMMPGFHGDGGAKRSRRPVCTAFHFLLSSAMVLLLDRHVWWAAAPPIDTGWHAADRVVDSSSLCTATPGRFRVFTNRDGKVKGRQLRGTFV